MRQARSLVLDRLGNALFMPRCADLGMAHRHGPRTQKRVALTFDDGPMLGGTEGVLEALSALQVLGTFFCLGTSVLRRPELVRSSFDEGHVIGAHSLTHARSSAVSLTETAHIDASVRAIREVLGRTPALYRPPWGWLTPWETLRLRNRGLEVIRWDVETPDSLAPYWPGDKLLAWTLPRVRPGSIVVCHDGVPYVERFEKPGTVHLVQRLVPALREQGYEFVTVPELLGIPAYQEDHAPNKRVG